MPTTLPAGYTSSLRNPFLSWLSTSFPYLAVPPLLILFVTALLISYEHPLLASERPGNFKWAFSICDEMGTCGIANQTSIRKMKRH